VRKCAVAVTFLLVVSGCGGSSDTATPVATVAPVATQAPTTTIAVTTTVAPTTTIAVTTTVAPTTTIAVTTTVAPTTTATPTVAPTTTTGAPAELAAVCTFDESVPKISCEAVGTSQGSQLRWESNVYGWKTGTSYEVEMVEEYQLVPEAIVTLQECQGSDCELVTTTIDMSAIAQTPPTTDSGSKSSASDVPDSPATTAAPTTTVPPDDTEVDQAELAAVCTFDESVPKISCHAVGFAQSDQLRWESNVSGWKTGASYEVELVEEYQLVPEVIVTLQECQGSDCELVTTTIDTSVIAQPSSTTEGESDEGDTSTADSPTLAPFESSELAAICSFDEPQRQLSCQASGQSGTSLQWTTSLDSQVSFGNTYETTLEWGQFVDEIQVQLEDCNGTECSVANWSTTVVLEARGDCPDDFAGWFTTFPLDDHTLIYEVGPPGRLVSVSDFKGHGYFRVPDWQNVIDVRLPIDGTLYAGSKTHFSGRDAAWEPELNYGLRFRTPCEGIWISFGHILQLSPSIAAIFDEIPAQDSSETLWVEPIEMSEGDVIGTAIGYALTGNAMVDFGVHDEFGRVRTVEHERGFGIHLTAACMYDFFSADIAAYLRNNEFTGDPVDEGLCPLRASTPGGP